MNEWVWWARSVIYGTLCILFAYKAHHAMGIGLDGYLMGTVIWGVLTFVAIREALS